MTAKTRAQLQAEGAQIANETNKRANTALRVGNTMLDIVEAMALGIFDVTSYGAATTGTGAGNDTAIAAALTAAVAAGGILYWPAGTYQSAASLAGLHSVRHVGAGAIQRGSDLFYLQPKSSQTNHIYIAATGASGNDGLSSSEPMATPQNAFDALANYGPVLEGTWRIECAAGTWNGTVHRNQHTTPSKNPVIVAGPTLAHPNVPTAIFDGTTGAVASDWAIRATGQGVQIDLRYLKAQNFVGGTDSCGFLADYGAVVYFTNIHGSGNSYSDTYFQGCTTIRGGGGIWASPRGALVNGCVDCTFGYGSIPIRLNGNITSGIEFSRGSEGHVDFCEFSDCAVGVDVMHNSRVHLQQNNFKRSTATAIRARSGGYYFDDANTFNDGTADENIANYLNYAFSGETDSDLWQSQTERRVLVNKNTITHTGTNATTVVATGLALPANWFEDTTKRLRVNIAGEFTTPAPSRIGIQFGGTTIDQSSATGISATGTQFRYQCDVVALAKDSQLKSARLEYNGGGSSPQIALNSPTADTDASQIVGITAKLNSSGDVMKIYLIEIWKTG